MRSFSGLALTDGSCWDMVSGRHADLLPFNSCLYISRLLCKCFLFFHPRYLKRQVSVNDRRSLNCA